MLYASLVISAITCAALLHAAWMSFTYYDNGKWVKSNLLAVYARSVAGYGTKAIEERRLPPNWGSLLGYAARNFTADLVGLDYSMPLSWEDIAAGPGLNLMRKTPGDGRTAIALYSTGKIEAGQESAVAVCQVQEDRASAQVGTRVMPRYTLTLYRPRFSAAAYVVKVQDIKPGTIAAEGGLPGSEPPFYDRMFDFALGLFKGAFEADSDARNVLVSPYGVTETLSMACVGGNGETRETMARVLGLPSADAERIVNQRGGYRSYLATLTPEIQVEVANSVWLTADRKIHFKPDFIRDCRDCFGAEARTVDFADPETPGLINAWVKDKTKGKIPSIVDRLEQQEIAALVNAVYMKARWQYPFDPQTTRKARFRMATGETIECGMMSMSGSFSYLEEDGFRAVRLPCGKGTMAMYFFLPDEGINLGDFVSSIMTVKWRKWIEGFEPLQGEIHLPRFSFDYDVKLVETLKGLGMGIAFDRTKADFSAMCEAPQEMPIFLSSVNHKTFISLDESGVEVAASAYIAVAGSAPSEGRFKITLDRPFAFAVRDERDGSLLFIGTVVRP